LRSAAVAATGSNMLTPDEKDAPFYASEPHKPSHNQNVRIAIKNKGGVFFINPSDVFTVVAQGDVVSLHRESDSYLLRMTLSEIAEKLEPYGFVRIHRSTLVNSFWVEEIRARPTGEYRLRLRHGKEFTVTRTYKKNLKSLAELWLGTDNFCAGE
jgi:two-component system, LytTR family, response regulator